MLATASPSSLSLADFWTPVKASQWDTVKAKMTGVLVDASMQVAKGARRRLQNPECPIELPPHIWQNPNSECSGS